MRFAHDRHPLAARFRRPAVRLATVVAALAAFSAMGAAAAQNPAGPHDPIGALTSLAPGSAPLTVMARGWAADPDDPTASATIESIVDGHVVALAPTTLARPVISARYGLGATPGFAVSIAVPDAGVHTVCVAVRNQGAGLATVLGCTMTPANTNPGSGHDPVGGVDSASASSSSLTVRGWADDPDFVGRRSTVVLYVDGSSTATVTTSRASAAQRAEGSPAGGGFAITVPVSTGAHMACVWAVSVGLGSNALLGCSAVDTRGPAGTDALATVPRINRAVVTEALSHIGGPYVWGAEGPNAFDCSGLVQYSYAKAGLTTPRVSGDQFRAARVIPASRALPGDLVFYHDSVGQVYHVGIYLSPGRSVAAIDTAEGINYQTIYDTTATYGSFTHD